MVTPKKKSSKSSKVVAMPAKQSAPEYFPIVGIGASAGGLSALEGFFSKFPADSRIAFVIIQHMDPAQKSMLAPLLSKLTSLKVSQIEEGTRIQPDCIYVTPPNRYVTIMERKLYLIEPKENEAVRLPIDHFFSRLSEEMGERAIGIVLSGTGSDGTLGLKAVKGVGGLTLAQDERQATHSGMPASAIASGCVDVVSEVETMPELLTQLLRHPYIAEDKRVLESGEAAVFVPKILNLIRTRTGNDFSKYKQNTTRRRIQRRMAVHRIERITEYFQYLQKNPGEVETLFKDLLIGVTNFFRDAKAFEVLAARVIAAIINQKTVDTPVRVWVPACATGEEAYSIAILLMEAMEAAGKYLNVQIFATDIDHDAIQVAREGVYADNIAADVSEKRLARFFVREGKTYRVGKHLREIIVFAVQNVIKDPPFSRLDLLSCRNLLIYLEPELQRKLLPLFHYTLNAAGFLFLGPSESASAFTDIFSAIDTKWKIFGCKPSMVDRHIEALPPFESAPARVPSPGAKPYGAADFRTVAQRILLDDYAPPSVLVNERYDILFYQGQTEKFLQLPVGEPSHNLMKLVRRDLHHKLSLALSSAHRQKKAVTSRGVQYKDGVEYRTVDIVVRPLADTEAPLGAMMVLFVEPAPAAVEPRKPPAGKERERPGKDIDTRCRQLEQELAYTRENLQTTIEELETSNEELKSTNEELQSTNEELQSTNEELETSKEEMHSTNEELVTVNSELQRKVTELEHVNNDISNLLAATDIGTLFLDGELRIKRFTPAVTGLFNLISTDVGRPIRDITSHLHYKQLERDAREVLDRLIPKELEVETDTGQLVTMRILPYRTVNNVIEGVVITFVHLADKAHAQLEAVRLTGVHDALKSMVPLSVLLLDRDLNVLDANAAITRAAGVTLAGMRGKPLSAVADPLWGKETARRLEKALKGARNIEGLALASLVFNSRRIEGPGDQGPCYLLTAQNGPDRPEGR